MTAGQRGGLNGPLANEPHWVYRLFAEDGSLLYVGCTSNVGQRLGNHAGAQPWWPEVRGIEVEHYPTMREGLDAERAVIEATQPKHNGTYTDRYDAGGHKRRRMERAEAHAAGALCRQRTCAPCNERAHALGQMCFRGWTCSECDALMPWYYADEPDDAAAWRELAARLGGEMANEYCLAGRGPVRTLAEVNDGWTLTDIRRAHFAYHQPITRRRRRTA